MTQTPTDALRLVPKYYATEPKEGGGGGYWEASIELTGGDYVAAEIYGNDREEVEERLKAALTGLLAAPASPLPGGGSHERWSILNHLGELWTPENFDTERQATAFLDRWKRDNPKMDLSKHKVIPVLVTMTAAPTGEPK